MWPSRKSVRMMVKASAKRATRRSKGKPKARYSVSFHPAPNPRIRRPPLISSTVPATLASMAGLWKLVQATSRAIAAISGQRTSRSTSGSWKPTLSGRVGLGLLDLVGLDDVALLEVLVAVDPDAALQPGQHLMDVILEALEARDLALVDGFVVAQDLGGRAACDLAVQHPRAGDDAELRDLDGREHFGAAFPDLDECRLV